MLAPLYILLYSSLRWELKKKTSLMSQEEVINVLLTHLKGPIGYKVVL